MKLITSLLLSIGIVFFLCSLITYNPYDTSLLYVSSFGRSVSNMCGILGAECAACALYLFGGAAFLLILPLFFCIFVLLTGQLFRKNWERIMFLCYGVVTMCGLLALYMVDVPLSLYPGGIVGLYIVSYVSYFFDHIGCFLFLYISLVSSFIISWRFSYMKVIRSLIYVSALCVHTMQKYKVVNRCMQALCTMLQCIFIRPIMYMYTFMQSLYDGTAFEGTGLIVPEEGDYQILFNQECARESVMKDASAECGPIIDEVIVFDNALFSSAIIDQEVLQTTYALPHLDIFVYEKNEKEDHDLEHELQQRAAILQDKLKRFGVSGEVVAIKRGPVVTLFEYQPDIDTKLSKIIALEDDLAMALQAVSIRILAPIPGKAVVGFEVANAKRNDVLFSQIVATSLYRDFKGMLPLVLGKGTIGEAVIVDLARMPHLLIAGSTGSGKSVALNALLISLLCKLDPDELKLILIDPKRLEFAAFADIAHLLFPIVTSANLTAPILRWVVQEMEQRYEKMAERGARNSADYNASLPDEERDKKLPSIVVVIDELADLMLTVGRDIEDLITRITQMARAAGIHMIVATQRPSVDVITGLIKANFPSRISFRVASRIDSRTILDSSGADRLLGRGDMLFLDASTSQLRRVHGAYVSDKEIDRIVNHIREQRGVEYLDIYKEIREQSNNSVSTEDPLYQEICLFLNEIDEISISLVQRKFRIGYNRSARIIDILESQGLIMPQDGGKMRKVIR